MSALLLAVFDLLVQHGPWILFLLAVAETSFVTGLVVPSGVATSLATVLALQGRMSLAAVAAAAVLGGAVGDSVGFWVGRKGAASLGRGEGLGGRVLRRHRHTTGRFFGRRPLYSVTLARLVSFVRTLMPMAAGMSGLPYRRYLAWEIPGVVAWALMYMAIGLAARESWQRVTSLVGVGWTLFFVAVGILLWLRSRGRAPDRDAPDALAASDARPRGGEPC